MKSLIKVHLINGAANWKAVYKVTNTDARRTQAKVPHFGAGLAHVLAQNMFAKGLLDEASSYMKLHLSNGSVHWKAAPKVTNTDARRTQAKVPYFAAGL